MDWRPYIEQRPGLMLGKPVIRGTRLTVEQIVEDMANGAREEDILAAYPFLTGEQVRAALVFGS